MLDLHFGLAGFTKLLLPPGINPPLKETVKVAAKANVEKYIPNKIKNIFFFKVPFLDGFNIFLILNFFKLFIFSYGNKKESKTYYSHILKFILKYLKDHRNNPYVQLFQKRFDLIQKSELLDKFFQLLAHL